MIYWVKMSIWKKVSRINLESGDSAAFDLGAELDKIRLTIV